MSDTTIRTPAFQGGVLGGPLVLLSGFALLQPTGLFRDDSGLLLLLALPFALGLPFLLVPATRAAAWRFLLGAAVGIALTVLVVWGGITLLATMLSDPA